MATNKVFDDDGNEVVVDEQTEIARKKAFEALSKKCILVNLDRKLMSNFPFDVTLSEDIVKVFGIKTKDAIQLRKHLVDPQHLSTIRSIVNDAMLMLWNYTRPWNNVGYRLLPMKYYDDFVEQFTKMKDEFEEAVQVLYDNWENIVKESKTRLGKAFNKAQYPDKNNLKDLFELNIVTKQLPDIDDIRLNLSGSELVLAQREMEDKFTNANNDAMKTILRLAKNLKDNTVSHRLIDAVEKLNVNGNIDINLEIAEAKDLIKYVEEEVNEKDMMVMDDLEDLEDVGDFDSDVETDETTECAIDNDDDNDDNDKEGGFSFKEAL